MSDCLTTDQVNIANSANYLQCTYCGNYYHLGTSHSCSRSGSLSASSPSIFGGLSVTEPYHYPKPTEDLSIALERTKYYLYDALWGRCDELDKKIDRLTETLAELLKAMREVQCR